MTMTDWIDDAYDREHQVQNQYSEEAAIVQGGMFRFWEELEPAIERDAQKLMEKFPTKFVAGIKVSTLRHQALTIEQTIMPADYIQVSVDSNQHSIRIEHQRVNNTEKRPKPVVERVDLIAPNRQLLAVLPDGTTSQPADAVRLTAEYILKRLLNRAPA
jgi:hypothetical protein